MKLGAEAHLDVAHTLLGTVLHEFTGHALDVLAPAQTRQVEQSPGGTH